MPSGEGFETVVLRPRLVWGAGDTTLLPAIADAVRAGRFAWIGGGGQLTDTTHVDNVVEGLVLAADKGRAGEAYFVTDGEPVVFREFISELLETQGVEPPTRSVPAPLAAVVAGASEAVWRLVSPRRRAPTDPVWAVALLPGVHDRDLEGALGAGLRAGHEPRRRGWPSCAPAVAG